MELRDTPTEQLVALSRIIKDELKRRRVKTEAIKRINFIHNLRVYGADTGEEYRRYTAAIRAYNTNNLLALSAGSLSGTPGNRVKYLDQLLGQDWSRLFADVAPGSNDFYVYAHCDPRLRAFAGTKEVNGVMPGQPFYIGKGSGDRAWCMKRNQGHGLRLREVLQAGFAPSSIVHIVRRGLPDAAALELEAKLVYFFGTIYEDDRKGVLLNLDVCKRPAFVGEMKRFTSRTAFHHKLEKAREAGVELAPKEV